MRGRGPARPPGALSEDYWQNVQDLFTRDVSARAFRDLFAYDAQDAFRYFTREVDLDGIWPRPWYQAYPMAAWKIFLAIAFRLSPARRIMFALAVPLLILGWVRFLLASIAGGGWEVPTIFTFALVAATLISALSLYSHRAAGTSSPPRATSRSPGDPVRPPAFEPLPSGGHVDLRGHASCEHGGRRLLRHHRRLGERHVALAMGDVAGKGIPAALLMALLQGSLRTLLSAGLRGADLMRTLNAHLHANIPSNRLITLFYAEYDPFTGSLRYVNGGHNAPYVLRPGGVERLHATGVCLGIVPDAVYHDVWRTTLVPGDQLFPSPTASPRPSMPSRTNTARSASKRASSPSARSPLPGSSRRARGDARLLREHAAPRRHDHDARRALSRSPPRARLVW